MSASRSELVAAGSMGLIIATSCVLAAFALSNWTIAAAGVLGGLGVFGWVWGIDRFAERRRYCAQWKCPRCGYSLFGWAADAACPECGKRPQDV